jgi:hypothetical protein
MKQQRQTKNKKRMKRKTKRMKGGIILFQSTAQDIMPELIRLSTGKIKFISNGSFGLIFQLTTEESPVFCELNSILVKVVSIDSNLEYSIEGESIEIQKIKIPDFQKEVHIQQEVCERSIDRFHCSIAPTLLHAEIYTPEELMSQFPNIGSQITTKGRVGLIFMEHIKNVKSGELAQPIGDYYDHPPNKNYTIHTLFPISRRLLIMLAQLGFYHNDFHLGNILYGGNACYIIDFGKATPIPEDKLVEFNHDVELYTSDESLKPKIIEFLYGHKLPLKPSDESIDYFLSRQWLCHNQTETFEPGIDPSVKIAPQDAVVKNIRIQEDKKHLCVRTPKIPYVEREAQKETAERIARIDKEIAERLERERLAKEAETPEQRASREEKERIEKEQYEATLAEYASFY